MVLREKSVTYFTYILVIYIFTESTRQKPDDIAMLCVYALFPAMLTYGLSRFVRKNNENVEDLKKAETS